MSNQQQSIGFWQGLGMAWTAAIMAIVKSLQSVEVAAGATLNVAESAQKGTEVMKSNVNNWAEGAMIEAELAKVAAEAKRFERSKQLNIASA